MLSSESSPSFTALESALLFEKKQDDILITVEKAALLAEPVMASVATPVFEELVEKAEVAGEPVEAEEVDPELESEETLEEAPAEELLGSALDQSDQSAQDERPDDHQPQSKRAAVILRQVQKLLTGCISLLQAKLYR